MTRIVLALLIVLSLTGTSAATTFLFTMHNKSGSDISRFNVRGGQIEGSTSVPSGGKREVKVTLADGKCRAEIRIEFASENYIDDTKVIDFCRFGGLTIN